MSSSPPPNFPNLLVRMFGVRDALRFASYTVMFIGDAIDVFVCLLLRIGACM